MLWLLTLSCSLIDSFGYEVAENDSLAGKFEGTEEEVKAKAETLNPDPAWAKEQGIWNKDENGILTFRYETAPFLDVVSPSIASPVSGWEEVHCIPFDKVPDA